MLCLKLNILLKKVVFIIQRKLNNDLSISKKIGIAIDLGLFRAMCPIGKYSTHHDYIAICGCNVDRYRLILWITFPQYMDQDKWNSFLTHLIKNERHGLASFLKNSNAIFQENDTIDLICKNYGHSVYLIDQRSLLESELKSFYEKDLKINPIVGTTTSKTSSEPLPILSYQNSIDQVISNAGLRSQLSFGNYATSSNNEFCVAASKAVVDHLGKSYNPLFIWGGVGVGKTHLMMAIGNEVLRNDPAKKVRYSTCEGLVSDLIYAIRKDKKSELRRKYREVDLLMIDDIQFIANKESSETELFNIFNDIINRQGQIVFTSDTPPNKLKNIDERLLSRFASGLVTEIEAPSFELRCAILIFKAKDESFDISYEILEKLASKHSSVREMIGELVNLKARSILMGQEMNIDLLDSYSTPTTNNYKKPASHKDIIRVVCAYFDLSSSDIKGSSRTQSVSTARQVTMYLLRTKAQKTLLEIAQLLGRKDHTTVMHAIKRIEGEKMKNPSFAKLINDIIKEIEG